MVDKKAKYNRERIMERANEMYQVCEHDGSLWFVFDGKLVCEMSMFSCQSTVEVLKTMREKFINTNESV